MPTRRSAETVKHVESPRLPGDLPAEVLQAWGENEIRNERLASLYIISIWELIFSYILFASFFDPSQKMKNKNMIYIYIIYIL